MAYWDLKPSTAHFVSMATVADDSLQQFLHGADADCLPSDTAILSVLAIGSSSDSAGEMSRCKMETAAVRRRPAPRGTAAYPRKRANRACQVCRARRTKCDNKKPSCSFCEKVGAKCITTPTDLSSYVYFHGQRDR
jgi:hypothetical protein